MPHLDFHRTEPSAVAPGQVQLERHSMSFTRRYRARFCAMKEFANSAHGCSSEFMMLLFQHLDEFVDNLSNALVDRFSRKRAAKLIQIAQASENCVSIGKKIYEACHFVYAYIL